MSPTLDLEALELKSGAHEPNSREMCIMEAVAYVANEPWSDHPKCASPAIAAFLRNYNDCVSDEVRQDLKPFILRLVGTAASREVEARRATLASDWYIRVHVPAWLRLAGLTTQADALAAFPEIISFEKCPALMPILEGIRADARAAWSAAESAAERAAWSAAERAARREAESAAERAAWSAAERALLPTTKELQASVLILIEKMIEAK